MKRIFLFLFLFGLATFFLNCSEKKYKDIAYNYDKLEILTGKVIIGEDSLYSPLNIEFSNNSIFLYDNQNPYPISVFDSENGFLKERFGNVGRGPGEIEYLGNFDFVEDTLILYDAQNFNVIKYFDFELSSEISQFKIDPLGLTLQVVGLSDSLYVASGLIGNRTLALYNSVGKHVGNIGELKGDTVEPISVRQHVFRKSVTANKKVEKIATSYMYTDLIEIYNFNGTRLASKFGPYEENPIYKIENARMKKVDETRINYISVKSTENYIYGLYSGRLASAPSNNVGNLVHIFDWNGNFIEALKFKEFLFDITIDDKDDNLYGLAFFPTFSVIKYDLQK